MAPELWRSLRVGDNVRIVAWPEELREETMHEDTFKLYNWLIDSKAVLTIEKIDAWGLPYGTIVSDIDGEEVWDTIALNHGGLEVLNPSNPSE